MTTSEPTTGEIAVFIPMKKSNAIGIFSSINLGRWTQKEKDNAIKTILCAPVPKEISKERMSDVIKFLADRIDQLQRETYRDSTQVTGYCPICAERAKQEQQEPEPPKIVNRTRGEYKYVICPTCKEEIEIAKPYTEETRYCGACGKLIEMPWHKFCGCCGAPIATEPKGDATT